MAKQTIDYLKSRFETGDKPTQQDFWDLLDTFLSIDSAAESYAAKTALSDYLTIDVAGTTYLKITDAQSSYLSKTEAAAKYLPQNIMVRLTSSQASVTFTLSGNWIHVFVLEYQTDGTFIDITTDCKVQYTAQNKVVVKRRDGNNFAANTYFFG